MANYRRLTTEEEILQIANQHQDAWKNPVLPQRQYDVNIKELLMLDLNTWENVAPYKAFMEAIKSLDFQKDDTKVNILEVGSSSGYYGKLLKVNGYKWDYTGCDYSPHFKELAEKHFKGIKIETEDAKNLTYKDASFDIVVSGCCLIHIYDWQKVIAETARVYGKYAIFHRTPLLEQQKTIYWEKLAYEVPCLEIWLNRDSFYRELDKHGFKPLKEVPVFRTAEEGGFGHYTIVCGRK